MRQPPLSRSISLSVCLSVSLSLSLSLSLSPLLPSLFLSPHIPLYASISLPICIYLLLSYRNISESQSHFDAVVTSKRPLAHPAYFSDVPSFMLIAAQSIQRFLVEPGSHRSINCFSSLFCCCSCRRFSRTPCFSNMTQTPSFVLTVLFALRLDKVRTDRSHSKVQISYQPGTKIPHQHVYNPQVH